MPAWKLWFEFTPSTFFLGGKKMSWQVGIFLNEFVSYVGFSAVNFHSVQLLPLCSYEAAYPRVLFWYAVAWLSFLANISPCEYTRVLFWFDVAWLNLLANISFCDRLNNLFDQQRVFRINGPWVLCCCFFIPQRLVSRSQGHLSLRNLCWFPSVDSVGWCGKRMSVLLLEWNRKSFFWPQGCWWRLVWCFHEFWVVEF